MVTVLDCRITFPPSSPFMRVLDTADLLIGRLCPVVAGGVIVGGIYWSCVTFGAVTIMQVSLIPFFPMLQIKNHNPNPTFWITIWILLFEKSKSGSITHNPGVDFKTCSVFIFILAFLENCLLMIKNHLEKKIIHQCCATYFGLWIRFVTWKIWRPKEIQSRSTTLFF